jgi:hypothetical protein
VFFRWTRFFSRRAPLSLPFHPRSSMSDFCFARCQLGVLVSVGAATSSWAGERLPYQSRRFRHLQKLIAKKFWAAGLLVEKPCFVLLGLRKLPTGTGKLPRTRLQALGEYSRR